jgi:predicted nucleic acid-binding Zn ribbon protein
MPTYQFLNTETGEEFEVLMKISEREEYLKSNPHIQSVLTAPALVSGVSTSNSRTGRVPEGFKEVLSKVAEKHPTSKVAQRYGKKSIKQVKTEQIIKKHLG